MADTATVPRATDGARSPGLPVIGLVHAAAIGASWLFAALIYALAVVRSVQIGWVAIDAALIAGCAGLVWLRRDALGFRSLGARRAAKLVAIVAGTTACVLLVQLAIRDRNGIYLD